MKREIIRAGDTQYFADTLRNLRTSRQPLLSQRMLANALGVSRETYAKYETGTRLPPAWFVAKVAAYFGVSADELLSKR